MPERFVLRVLFALCLGQCLLLSGCGGKEVSVVHPPAAPMPVVQMEPRQALSQQRIGARVLATAKTQLGLPYRYGGMTPGRGFDCSGLVCWAYGKHGVKLPRRSWEQATAGVSVARKNVRVGDIVVFRIGRSRRSLHTGLYAGSGQFVHSPRTGKKVRVDRLDNPYWSRRLVTVRRVVN